MAKDLVRTRNQIQKFYRLHSQLQAVSLRIQVLLLPVRNVASFGHALFLLQTLQSTQAMAEAMKGVARAMYTMNRQMNLPAMQRIMMVCTLLCYHS